MNILLADDDPMLHTIIELWLVRQGHHVEHAANGKEALGLLSRKVFDLLVTDINMPVLDGIELIQKALKLDIPPRNVILLTSRCDTCELKKQFDNKNIFIFNKPFSPAQLVETIDDLQRVTA